MKTIRLLTSVFFLGLAASKAADALPAAPATTTPKPAAAPTVESLTKELDAAKAQIAQLTAAVRKLQEQRNALAQQLLDAEVQKAAEAAK